MTDTNTKKDESEKTLVILIDSFEKVSDEICLLDDFKEENFEVKVLNPFDSKKDDKEEQKDYLCRLIKEFLDEGDGYNNHILISNKEYFEFERRNGETFFTYKDKPLSIDKLLKADNGVYPLDKNFRNKLSSVLIYSYNRWYPQEFHRDAKELVEELKNNKDSYPGILKDEKGRSHVVIPETGLVFRLYPFENLSEVDKDCLEDDSSILIGSSDIVKRYCKFITSIVEEFIKNENEQSLRTQSNYLHLNSLRYNKFISMINEEYFKKDSKYELATVSVIADDIKMYLLDVPYRYYYASMNEYITEKGLDNYFKKEENDEKTEKDYKQSLNYTYFNYEVNSTDSKIYLNSIFKFENEKDEKPRRVFENKVWSDAAENNNLLEWLSILDASIFYNDDGIKTENNGAAEERKWSDNFTERIVDDKSCKINESTHIIEILWFYHDIQMEEYGLHSAINYSFFRVNEKSSASNDSIKNIHDIAKRFYDYRRPIIVAKAKEVLFPYYHSEMMKYALQSAVSQITARNYAHHIGSHVKNRTTLPEINKRIGKLYPKIDF